MVEDVDHAEQAWRHRRCRDFRVALRYIPADHVHGQIRWPAFTNVYDSYHLHCRCLRRDGNKYGHLKILKKKTMSTPWFFFLLHRDAVNVHFRLEVWNDRGMDFDLIDIDHQSGCHPVRPCPSD